MHKKNKNTTNNEVCGELGVRGVFVLWADSHVYMYLNTLRAQSAEKWPLLEVNSKWQLLIEYIQDTNFKVERLRPVPLKDEDLLSSLLHGTYY